MFSTKYKKKVLKYEEGGKIATKEPTGYDVDLPRVYVDDRYPGKSSAIVSKDLGSGFSVEGKRRQWRDEPPAYEARLTYKKEF